MSTITFDTLRFTKTLEQSGIPQKQAEAIAQAMQAVNGESDLVTKKDLQIIEERFNGKFAVMQWMLGILLAGVMSLVLKAFF